MKMLLLSILIVLVTGCTTLKAKICDYNIIPPAKPMQIDPRVLEPCGTLALPSVPLTYEGILINTKENAAIFHACKVRNANAIILIKKLSNITE